MKWHKSYYVNSNGKIVGKIQYRLEEHACWRATVGYDLIGDYISEETAKKAVESRKPENFDFDL